MSFLVAFGAWVAFHAVKYDFPNSVKSISPALSDREIERDNKNKYSLFKITSYVNLGITPCTGACNVGCFCASFFAQKETILQRPMLQLVMFFVHD